MSRRSGLRDANLKLKAGDAEILSLQGNYLRISSAISDVIVEIEGNDVFKLSPGEDVVYPVEEEFSRVVLTTMAAVEDLVTVTVGKNVRVGSAKVSGSVAISNNPDVNILGNLPGIDSIVKTVEDGFEYGGSFKSSGILAAGGNVVVVAPAANLNGMILWDAAYYSNSGSGGAVALLASPSTPSAVTTGDMMICPAAFGTNGLGSNKLNRPVKIKPGWGLYFFAVNSETASVKNALYTLL